MLEKLAYLSAGLGIGSIAISILTWFKEKGDDEELNAHAERFGIFVGLWPSTFIGLSMLLMKMKDEGKEKDLKKLQKQLEKKLR